MATLAQKVEALEDYCGELEMFVAVLEKQLKQRIEGEKPKMEKFVERLLEVCRRAYDAAHFDIDDVTDADYIALLQECLGDIALETHALAALVQQQVGE